MSVSRLGMMLAVLAAVVLGIVIGSEVMPSAAAQAVSICPPADLAGKPLTSQDLNVKGDTRCWYGLAHDPLYPCAFSDTAGVTLWRTGINADGQSKCVYRVFVVRPTHTPIIPPVRGETFRPPESTAEATQ